MPVRTVIECGPKGKRAVAFSLDWPGWSRGGKTPVARDTLEAYRPRYRPIAELAGMADEFDAAGPLEVAEDRIGTGSTDFWATIGRPTSPRCAYNTGEVVRRMRSRTLPFLIRHSAFHTLDHA